MIASRHSPVTDEILREKCQIKAEKYRQRGQLRKTLGIHLAGHFGPPVVDTAKVCHYGSAHHDVVKMRDHKVSVRNVNIYTECGQEKAGQTSRGEQTNK